MSDMRTMYAERSVMLSTQVPVGTVVLGLMCTDDGHDGKLQPIVMIDEESKMLRRRGGEDEPFPERYVLAEDLDWQVDDLSRYKGSRSRG